MGHEPHLIHSHLGNKKHSLGDWMPMFEQKWLGFCVDANFLSYVSNPNKQYLVV
jgi:hypothetical protein